MVNTTSGLQGQYWPFKRQPHKMLKQLKQFVRC